MERYGPSAKSMREFNHYDTLRSRVNLLVIMLKAFLDDSTLQGIRLNTIAKNVVEVDKICEDRKHCSIRLISTSRSNEGFKLDHILYHRISLLSMIAKSVVLGNPMGKLRKKVISDNISYIVDALQLNPQEEITSYQKAA